MHRANILRRTTTTSLSLALLTLTFGAVRAQPDAPDLAEFRTIDGSNNNPQQPDWGAAGTPHRRLVPPDYADGAGTPPGASLPGARAISNAVATQWQLFANARNASNFLWQWGQFIDHDITLTRFADPPEAFDIPVPPGDPFFDPDGTGTQSIPLSRSEYVLDQGVRQQVNSNTSFIDASMVYGSDPARASELRAHDGSGRLKVGENGLLPLNVNGLPNEPTAADPELFLAGDVRVNEQPGLTAMHTVFMREHNGWCDWLATNAPWLSGDEIYETARAIVTAEIQAITYREFLPMLIGSDVIPPYAAYDAGRQPGTSNLFTTGVYRVGHTLLPDQLLRIDAAGAEIPEGHLSLADAFFNPKHIKDTGIEPVLRGLVMAPAQEIDPLVIDDVRNFLFGLPGHGGMDLVSLNLQRGRDHGLPRYNAVRVALGLEPRAGFDEVSSDPDVVARLSSVYAHVDDVDVWIAGLCEDHAPGAMVGELFRTVISMQFEAFRDGDRFWYQSYLPPAWVDHVESQTLATIIRRNSAVGAEFPDDAFLVPAITAVLGSDSAVAPALTLGYPYPNPSAGGVSVLLSLGSGVATPSAGVFDVSGRQVAVPHLSRSSTHEYRVQWNGLDSRQGRVAPGVYFVVVTSEGEHAQRKLVITDR